MGLSRRGRRAAAAAALRRPRCLRPVVRAVRNRPARGDGLRRPRRGLSGGRTARHRRRRRHRRPRASAAARPDRGCASRAARGRGTPRQARPGGRGASEVALRLGSSGGGRAVRVRGRSCPTVARGRGGGAMIEPAPFTVGHDHLASLAEPLSALESDVDRLGGWGRHLARVLITGGRLLAAGNGGSAAQAQHLTSELVGRYRDERPALSALALHAESSSLTAIANDYGAEEAFARQVRAHGRPGDVLIALTTSGRSANVLAAVGAALAGGLNAWAFTGPPPNPVC